MAQKHAVKQPEFLPMTLLEMRRLGWEELDILLITGDAYVDHPSFGVAVIGRWLVAAGYRVGIIAQPDWRSAESVAGLGRPLLWAGITAGAMDSMVANYTANKKLRRQDAYTPGSAYGKRPNRATIIYSNLIKQAFPGLPVVLGGIEASLRRLVHYDYWSDSIRRSVLFDAKADYLVYGMAERTVVALSQALEEGRPVAPIAGLAIIQKTLPRDKPYVILPSYEAIIADWRQLGQAALAEEAQRDWRKGKPLVQAHGQRYLVCNPPAQPLDTLSMDRLFGLPFQRQVHPHYHEKVAALEPVLHSIISHRGCFGGCTFCALGAHQGKAIQSRSVDSLIEEAKRLAARPDFHGTITDVGGPSANMWGLDCRAPHGACQRPSCLMPSPCRHLNIDQTPMLKVLARIQQLPKVKHVFVASGVRYDLALQDKAYLAGLVKGGHISGALKVAPEHSENNILALMGKPTSSVFEAFIASYRQFCRQFGQHDFITAYFISAFPGSDRQAMQQVAAFAKKWRLRVEQLQDFIPLPMTMAGIMYALGENPYTGHQIKVVKLDRERKTQRRTLLGHPGSVKNKLNKPAAKRYNNSFAATSFKGKRRGT